MALALSGFAARPASVPALAPPRQQQKQHRAAVRAQAAQDGISWLSSQAGAAAEEAAAEAAAAEAAAADDSLARSVGLGAHIRGRTTFREGLTDEEDPARFVFHRALKQAAATGAWAEAAAVLEDMSRAGHVPGPRAYHALVFSHVKARHTQGALAAIRRCWDAGITPLPETYAAVVAAHCAAGDLDTAEAVCASNRRAGVDCTKSWQQLVAALFRAGLAERALEALEQGQGEGLAPSEAVYEGLVGHLCGGGDLEGARGVLQAMQERGMRPQIGHYSPLIAAYAARGEPQAAYELMGALLANGAFPQGMQGVCDTVLEAQLAAAQSAGEVSAAVGAMKAVMLANGMQAGSRFFAAQLRAALRVGDLQPAIQAFRALRTRTETPLHFVDDDTLAQLLLAISGAAMPAELYEVLSAMCREGRAAPAAAMAPDERGCTVLGAWVQQRLAQAQAATVQHAAGTDGGDRQGGAPPPRAAIVIDGVSVDPASLAVVDAGGAPLAVSRMGVRELRAELAARRAPVSGNKKELAKRLQKLRQLDAAGSSTPVQRLRSEQKGESQRKVSVVVTDRVWVDGRLVEETRYESEREVEAVQEEEGEEGGEWEMDMGEEGETQASSSRARSGAAAVEEELFDDDAGAFQQPPDTRLMLAYTPHFSSAMAGPHEAASMLLGAVVDLGAQPSVGDVHGVAAYVHAARDVPAAVLLAAALDSLPEALEGGAEVRAALGELCAEHDVSLDAAVDAVLLGGASDPELRAIEEELAEYSYVC